MRTLLYERLRDLHKRHGCREFGKVFQKFVALAYRAAGYTHIVERGVQGVDVDAANGPWGKHAIEVKTTLTDSVEFKQKDMEGLTGPAELKPDFAGSYMTLSAPNTLS